MVSSDPTKSSLPGTGAPVERPALTPTGSRSGIISSHDVAFGGPGQEPGSHAPPAAGSEEVPVTDYSHQVS
jgi:hypothetical protein